MRLPNLLVASLLAVVAPEVLAQTTTMPTRVVQRGGAAGFELSDGEPISYFLEHARALELTDTQRASLIDIRRRLRLVNAQHMRQLDSVREELGISLEPRRVTNEDLKALERMRKLTQPITDSIRVNNDAAKAEARALLNQIQVTRLDSLATADRDLIRGRRPPAPIRP